jgi:hypothetical protein
MEPRPHATRKGSHREQLADGQEPPVDALGVVKAVDTQHDHVWLAKLGPKLAGPALHSRIRGPLYQRCRVDRYREGAGPDPAAVVVQDRVGARRVHHPPSHPREVRCGAVHLEADEIGAEQPLQYRSAPWQLKKQLLGWNGMCKKNPMGRSGRTALSIFGTNCRW